MAYRILTITFITLAIIGTISSAAENCGGQQMGKSGILDGTLDMGCEWMLVAPEEFIIEIMFSSYSFTSCTDDAVYVANGNNMNNSEIDTFDCNKSPTIIFTGSNNAYVKLTKTNNDNDFYATWRAVRPPACCDNIVVDASPLAYINTNHIYNIYLGAYTKSAETTTDAHTGQTYPVYRVDADNRRFLGRKNIPDSHPWIMFFFGTALMFYGPETARCPDQLTDKQYYRQETPKEIVTETNWITFTCQTVCSTTPMGPADTTSNHISGTNSSMGTIVTFTCTIDESKKFYSQCLSDGTWSAVVGTCPECAQ